MVGRQLRVAYRWGLVIDGCRSKPCQTPPKGLIKFKFWAFDPSVFLHVWIAYRWGGSFGQMPFVLAFGQITSGILFCKIPFGLIKYHLTLHLVGGHWRNPSNGQNFPPLVAIGAVDNELWHIVEHPHPPPSSPPPSPR
jgi:hypothetical protein